MLANNPVSYFDNNQYPILDREQEDALLLKIFDSGCKESVRAVVMSYFRFVKFIASKYVGCGLPREDIEQEGVIGLMKAIKAFDPNRGVRLSTFSVHWIRSQIHDFILRNWSVVRIATTKAQRKLFFNLNKLKGDKEKLSQRDIEEFSKQLGVDESDTRNMAMRLGSRDISVYAQDDDSAGVIDVIADENSSLERQIDEIDQEATSKRLILAVKSLDERSRDIIQQRWLNGDDKVTLADLAKLHNVSTERVRQIEALAIKKLRALLD